MFNCFNIIKVQDECVGDGRIYIHNCTYLPSQNKHLESYTFLFISVAPTINHDLTTKSPQTVTEGQNITLTCIVSAEPPASIMWIYFNPNNPDAKDRKSSPSNS